jgi:hypothetical protein
MFRGSLVQSLKPEVQSAYRVATRTVELANAVITSVMFAARFSRRRRRQPIGVPDAMLIIGNIGKLAAQLCKAERVLLDVEPQIVKARGISPFVLAGAYYPCAHSAVSGLAVRVLDVICRAWAGEPRLCLVDCPNPLDSKSWVHVYREKFHWERLVDARGRGIMPAWQSYCQRCTGRMPAYDTGMVLTALGQEAVQWDYALRVEPCKDESPADASQFIERLAPAKMTAAKPTDHPSTALVSVFTNGLSDDRIKEASRLLADDTMTANKKLTKIDALIRFPPTASAEQLGKMLGVTKQAVMKTDWWIQNRKGEKDNEIGRRRAAHQKRAEEYEQPNARDGDD